MSPYPWTGDLSRVMSRQPFTQSELGKDPAEPYDPALEITGIDNGWMESIPQPLESNLLLDS